MRKSSVGASHPKVTPKKRFGQNFLIDRGAAAAIVDAVQAAEEAHVVEIGPGMGVLTQGLQARFAGRFTALELDPQAVEYLRNKMPGLGNSLVHVDCLQFNFNAIPTNRLALVGNLPYNISSQMLWLVLDIRDRVTECVFMLQREVARRIASGPGSREYGILSVLLQAFYNATLLLTLPPSAFDPPPQIHSSVLQLKRNGVTSLGCDEALLRSVVKGAFNQRRKTLRNSLNAAFPGLGDGFLYEKCRPETLGVEEFVALTNIVEERLHCNGTL